MRWVPSGPGDFQGDPPSPRSGHSAVRIGSTYVLIFGGLVDKKFLNDLFVFDIENKAWFQPECTGSSSSDETIGPIPRAFHVAVAIDCHLFIFGGRSGRNRLGDFWMLDTDIWQWAELTGFGDVPSARDFAAGAPIGDGKVVLYGGWDGSKWLSDVYILDTVSLEWRQLQFTGHTPPPRCGHTATMVEKRLLVFGGRGGGGSIMGDLWALKGLFDEEKEHPAWTQLKLSGQTPAPRCGHSVTAGGHQLLVYGGHGTGGWLTRYDVYHSDCVILDRASVQWKRLSVTSESPPPRAYHTITRVGNKFLLIGGYDGKSTFGDFWWLVSEEDPMAKRAFQSVQKSPNSLPTPLDKTSNLSQVAILASHETVATEEGLQSPLVELRRRLGLSSLPVAHDTYDLRAEDEQIDKQLVAVGISLNMKGNPADRNTMVKFVREHWSACDPKAIHLKELGPLLLDYHRLIVSTHENLMVEWSSKDADAEKPKTQYRFFHLKNARQLRIEDIPHLLIEYKMLLQHQKLLEP